jgi:hypothetical protein
MNLQQEHIKICQKQRSAQSSTNIGIFPLKPKLIIFLNTIDSSFYLIPSMHLIGTKSKEKTQDDKE